MQDISEDERKKKSMRELREKEREREIEQTLEPE